VSAPIPDNNGQEFHARFSACARTYHYVLYNNPVRSPLLVARAGWVFRPLDVPAMQRAAQYLLGTHDFSAFRSSECQAKTPVKLMHDIRIEQRGDLIIFTLKASAFLHHMVRNIVGSLIFVGTGSREDVWMKEILEARDRARAAPTFMPDGLYLAKVDYDPAWGLPDNESTLQFLG
jgi:tRNA pseudouridine38-40 synthase